MYKSLIAITVFSVLISNSGQAASVKANLAKDSTEEQAVEAQISMSKATGKAAEIVRDANGKVQSVIVTLPEVDSPGVEQAKQALADNGGVSSVQVRDLLTIEKYASSTDALNNGRKIKLTVDLNKVNQDNVMTASSSSTSFQTRILVNNITGSNPESGDWSSRQDECLDMGAVVQIDSVTGAVSCNAAFSAFVYPIEGSARVEELKSAKQRILSKGFNITCFDALEDGIDYCN